VYLRRERERMDGWMLDSSERQREKVIRKDREGWEDYKKYK
jgi:hypothetical protein